LLMGLFIWQGQAIPLSKQVNNWLSIHEEVMKLEPSAAQFHLSKSLFTVVIGSNDLFDYFGSFKLRRQSNPQQYTQLMADKLKEQLKVNKNLSSYIVIYLYKLMKLI